MLQPKFNLLMSNMSPDNFFSLIESRNTFVINVVANWCADCVESQCCHINEFKNNIESLGISFYQIVVQNQKNKFISDKHKKLTDFLGGHGFPRTVLFIRGREKINAIELIEKQQLDECFFIIENIHNNI